MLKKSPMGRVAVWLPHGLWWVLAFGCTSSCIDAAEIAETAINLHIGTNQVSRFQKAEFQIQVSTIETNPSDPDKIDLSLQITTPAGGTLSLPAYWEQPFIRARTSTVTGLARDWIYPSGAAGWKARFAPAETGNYSVVARLKHGNRELKSAPVSFKSVPGPSKGFVRISGKDPRFLEFSEGSPFFAIGQNLAFIGDQQYVSLSKAEQIFNKLSTNGANYLRIWTCCEDWAMAIEARKSAFGRSWDWHPALAPAPDSAQAGRKCLKLDSSSALRVDPSHPLAVRPSTRYRVSGKVWLANAARLELELNGKLQQLALGVADRTGAREFVYNFQTGAGQFWLAPFSFRFEGQGNALIDALSLQEDPSGPELLWEADVNRAIRGWYNPVDCFMLDELVAAAEEQGIYLQLCLLTRDLYMSALKNAQSAEYKRTIHDACRTLRYAVARWGYSTAVAAWEYWNEMDPGLPTDDFYSALGTYLEQVDVYHHLRTTSTWGPSAKDCRHPKLDVADVHFYLRPADKGRLEDEVDAVLERTRWLRAQSTAKPAHLGEFGLANDKWQPTPEMGKSPEVFDLHNALWASALSGASGTAMFWWWERLDQRNFYPQYRILRQFIAAVPWNSGEVQSVQASCSDARVRVIALRAGSKAWCWLFNREASWNRSVVEAKTPGSVTNAQARMAGFPADDYDVHWLDTWNGATLETVTATVSPEGNLTFTPPPFTRDIAVTIAPR